MKNPRLSGKSGFSLLETVIAIGVLAVLLTGFIIVFTPAAAGIKKSISVQEADRLTSTLEQELVTLRSGDTEKMNFEKAFNCIQKSNTASDALLIYQYRGNLTENPRSDGTPPPLTIIKDKTPGKDYLVQTIMRRKSDPNFTADLPAVEGGVYLVKCTQLVFKDGELKLGTIGKIIDPKGTVEATSADTYPEAVIAFSAEFFSVPSKSPAYLKTGGKFDPTKLKTPIFTRNLAVRR